MRIITAREQVEMLAPWLRVAMPWYHVSPHDFPNGTDLRPGGDSPWDETDYAQYLPHDTADHVWLSPDTKNAHEWRETMGMDSGISPLHVYEVEPHGEPRPYDDEEEDPNESGYVAPGARVVRKHATTHQTARLGGAAQDWYAANPQLSRPERPGMDKAYAGTLKKHQYPDELAHPLYHGTRGEFAPGDMISSGYPGNFVRRMKHVYVSDQPEKSHQYGGAVYEVKPTGPVGYRSDARPEQGYFASEWPMQVVRKVPAHEYADQLAQFRTERRQEAY